MPPEITKRELELKKRIAIRLIEAGDLNDVEIAQEVGVAGRSVGRWRAEWRRQKGHEATKEEPWWFDSRP